MLIIIETNIFFLGTRPGVKKFIQLSCIEKKAKLCE